MLPSGRYSDHKGRKWVPLPPPFSEVTRSFELKLFLQMPIFCGFFRIKSSKYEEHSTKKHVFLNSASLVRSSKGRGYNIFLNKNK